MRIQTSLSLLSLPALAACGSPGTTAPVDTTLSQDLAVTTQAERRSESEHNRLAFKHVLLMSIDGLHEVDLEKFIAGHPASALSKLARHGKKYTNAFVNRLEGNATNPTDSFPGLLALTTGGSSPTHGGWYDVSYSRDLFAFSATAPCSGAPGTAVAYDESIDADLTFLWGSKTDDTPTHQVSVARTRFDLTKLPYA